jgi:hypothetical protein
VRLGPRDLLGRRIFWRVDDALALPSAHYSGHTTAESVLETDDISSPYYQAIAAAMERTGVNRVPVLIAPAFTMWWVPFSPPLAGSTRPVVGDGHHRLKIAIQLGWTRILTTDRLTDSIGPENPLWKGLEYPDVKGPE